jgi:hypothetical protein
MAGGWLMRNYLSILPCPVNAASLTPDYGLLRDEATAARPNQRRKYIHTPTQIQLTFVLGTDLVRMWVDWMTQYGYDWFNLKLPNVFVPRPPAPNPISPSPILGAVPVRLIGESLPLSYQGNMTYAIPVVVELSPVVYAQSGWL